MDKFLIWSGATAWLLLIGAFLVWGITGLLKLWDMIAYFYGKRHDLQARLSNTQAALDAVVAENNKIREDAAAAWRRSNGLEEPLSEVRKVQGFNPT